VERQSDVFTFEQSPNAEHAVEVYSGPPRFDHSIFNWLDFRLSIDRSAFIRRSRRGRM